MVSSKEWTKDRIENHLIKLLLDNCYKMLQLNYDKITITKSESPDFIIGDCKNTIGIEITRALDQNMQKVSFIRDTEFNNTSICPTLFEDEQMSKQEIINLLNKSKDKLIGRPYKGYELEEKVLNDIVNAISKKIKKFDSYKKFNENILLVHSETRATLDIDMVTINLSKYLIENKDNIKYNSIFLKLGNQIFNFKNENILQCHIK